MDFTTIEGNSFYAMQKANHIVKSVSLYMEPRAATEGGYGYCTPPADENATSPYDNHPCGAYGPGPPAAVERPSRFPM